MQDRVMLIKKMLKWQKTIIIIFRLRNVYIKEKYKIICYNPIRQGCGHLWKK